jgi:predicted permease
MTKLWRRFHYLLRHDRMEADLAEEMAFHRAMLERDGAAPSTMGNVTMAREASRGVWIWPWLESVWQDARYGVRTLRAQAAFTLVALVALGSAIGINTSLFTVFNAMALRPWPVRDPGRVVRVLRVLPKGGTAGYGHAEADYLAAHSRSLSGVIATDNREDAKSGDRPLHVTLVSANYFQVLGVPPVLGRGFLAAEDRAGAPEAVAVISDLVWRNQFGANPAILSGAGSMRIVLDEVPFTVVGVAPPEFTGQPPLRNDVWVPRAALKLLRPHDPGVDEYLTSPRTCCISVAGRLAPGVSRRQAEAEIGMLIDQFHASQGLELGTHALVTGTAWMDAPSKKDKVTAALVALFVAVTLVLLLACANVGNLLLARAAARHKEIAVRLSLGGSRARVVRQLLVESSLLAMVAAGLGLAIAYIVPPLIVARLGNDLVFHLTPDVRVLGYTMAIAVAACLAFGLAPALHGTRGQIAGAIRSGARLGSSRLPLRSVLLGVQVAISVLLLGGAGMMVRGLQRTAAIDPGFDYARVSAVQIGLPASQYGGERTKAFAAQIVAQLDRVAGLPLCGVASDVPIGNSRTSTAVAPDKGGERQRVVYHEVSGGYFEALGIPIVAGRNFTAEDAGHPVALLNQTAARRFWPGENPVGKVIASNGRTVVGVVKDAYTTDLNAIDPTMYQPISGGGVPVLVVRDPSPGALGRIEAIVKQLEPRAELTVEPLSANFRQQIQPSIYGAAVAGFLGLLALLLASVGMAGVFAYAVSQRTREIGVRMALGAQPAQVVRLVLASSLSALAIGTAAGLLGAAALSTLLVHTMPGIQPSDPTAYAAVLAILAAAVALASAIPARRATRIDPVRALRWE